MTAAYLIIQVDVRDTAGFELYRREGPPVLAKFGGQYVVRGGQWTLLEGEPPLPRQVVIRFPDRAAALAWYNSEEYAKLKEVRQAIAHTRMLLVDGADSAV